MEILNVIIAAAAAWIFGAVWYMALAKPWVAASGVETDADGKPANMQDKTPFIISFLCAIVVAGMMRHVFSLAGIDEVGKGFVAGLGIGLFMASPWIATNYAFAGRSRTLTLIDAGYATWGCAVIGLVLTLI